ncbi:MAG: hypothetical protein V8S92_09200 [Oscillospiraceae bacterium]
MAERPVLNGKKLCGILTELSVSLETQEPEYVVIGIGINCNQRDFAGARYGNVASHRSRAPGRRERHRRGAASGAFAGYGGST